jgi:hypothetical protein
MKYWTALGVALFMLAFALGIPLLGWGVGDWAGFLSNSARTLYALCVLSWALSVSIGLLLLPFPYTPGKRGGLGLAWVAWSFLTLGKQHSADVTIQAGHQLVVSGPYRWVRHPMYLGLIVFPWGAGLVFRSWIGALLPMLLIALFVWRIADEEQLMQREFGEQWEAYCRRTRRLIPFIY